MGPNIIRSDNYWRGIRLQDCIIDPNPMEYDSDTAREGNHRNFAATALCELCPQVLSQVDRLRFINRVSHGMRFRIHAALSATDQASTRSFLVHKLDAVRCVLRYVASIDIVLLSGALKPRAFNLIHILPRKSSSSILVA